LLTLALAMKASGEEGQPLPVVFPQLEEIGAKPRRGSITLVCAAPGGGKSAWMSEYAINLALGETKLRGMYFSADTDRMTLGKRAAAGILQCTTDEAEEWLKDRDHEIWDKMDQATNHIWTCFDAGLTLTDIEQEIQAYAYVNGEYPEFIVVDVLMNVQGTATSGDHVAFAETMEWLHMLARETGSAVFVLHHVTGMYEDGDTPIPLTGVLGKVTKFARLVLTLWRPDANTLGFVVAKNTSGFMDPKAQNYQMMPKVPWYPERSWFGRDADSIRNLSSVRMVDSIIATDDPEDDWDAWSKWSV
jgi:KaiC/GvpD/RAD55 family RecA-like ATPase